MNFFLSSFIVVTERAYLVSWCSVARGHRVSWCSMASFLFTVDFHSQGLLFLFLTLLKHCYHYIYIKVEKRRLRWAQKFAQVHTARKWQESNRGLTPKPNVLSTHTKHHHLMMSTIVFYFFFFFGMGHTCNVVQSSKRNKGTQKKASLLHSQPVPEALCSPLGGHILPIFLRASYPAHCIL